MKHNLILTADWHIRIKPDIDEQWQMNRYRQLTNKVISLCREHAAILVLAGDILDRNRPSLPELTLVLELLRKLQNNNIHTLLISGNHESLGQGASTYDFMGPYLEGLDCINYNTSQTIFFPCGTLDLYLVGHPALQGYEESDMREGKVNILISHFRPTVNQFIQEEIDVEKFIAPFDYCFAGDIHMPIELHEGKLISINHPLNSCFEANPDGSLILVEPAKQGINWSRIPLQLPNLVQKVTAATEFQEPDEDGNFYRIEVQGSPEELRQCQSERPDLKLLKIPVVGSEFANLEEPEDKLHHDFEAGVLSYLQELNLSEERIQQLMAVFREVDHE